MIRIHAHAHAHAACLVVLLAACASAQAGSLDATAKTSDGKALEDAAVVLEPLSGSAPPLHTGRVAASIEQRDREFAPYLTIVRAGAAVDFPNRDPIKHHVYSFSPAKRFEIKLYAGKPAQPEVFDKPGEVALGCNIHDWMEAYVLVVNSPYFAKTAANGHAVIHNVPAGRYLLRFWHPRQKAGPPAREIMIGATQVRLEQVMDVVPRIVKPKPANDANAY
ncbi:MAG: methylamine utilization protein [Betaproteobacteria bacterium]|nr:methylamine utilization protein [Betaproteobacteria bacterium]